MTHRGLPRNPGLAIFGCRGGTDDPRTAEALAALRPLDEAPIPASAQRARVALLGAGLVGETHTVHVAAPRQHASGCSDGMRQHALDDVLPYVKGRTPNRPTTSTTCFVLIREFADHL